MCRGARIEPMLQVFCEYFMYLACLKILPVSSSYFEHVSHKFFPASKLHKKWTDLSLPAVICCRLLLPLELRPHLKIDHFFLYFHTPELGQHEQTALNHYPTE